MTTREKFENEICSNCIAKSDCIKSLTKQAKCATLATWSILHKINCISK